MSNTKVDSFFLSKAKLSGFKSIESVDIHFEKGLNIIIGKNAAGKTNFLKFLHKNLVFEFDELNDFSSSLEFKNGKVFSVESNRKLEVEELFKNKNLNSTVESTLKVSNRLVKDKKNEKTTIFEKLREKGIKFDSTLICHGVPNEYPFVKEPFSFKVEKGQVSTELSKIYREYNRPNFIKLLAIELVLATFNTDVFNLKNIRASLKRLFSNIEGLSKTLAAYSPIQMIRFSDNYNVFLENDNEGFTLNNLFLEFKVDDNWLPFSSLSDGTRRLFYIISEFYDFDEGLALRQTSNRHYFPNNQISRILLIEEPELGIHPHQFHKLMQFLREEASEKQVIITSHSPQALDILDSDDLDRIIIAYVSEKDGTKLRHLDKNEKSKAREYIREEFLSDYWMYSDLED